MIRHCLVLLSAAILLVQAGILAPMKELLAVDQEICRCTTTVTEYRNPKILYPRQGTCPPPTTITLTQTLLTATIAAFDSSSVSSLFSYQSQLDSEQVFLSKQNRPTGEPPETTSLPFTLTAPGPAIVGTEAPGESIYHAVYTTSVPVSVATIVFPPADPASIVTITITVTSTNFHHSTTTTTTGPPSVILQATTLVSAIETVKVRSLEKRQTCSMVFAQIFGNWASWCNPWNGTGYQTYESYITTILETTPVGASPIPPSVYDPSGTLRSISRSISAAQSSISSVQPGSTVGVVFTTVVVTVTDFVHTVTETALAQGGVNSSSTSNVPETSTSCGQVGDFVITFDDLPPSSTKNSDQETEGPHVGDRYDHFYWTSGYRFVPQPHVAYSAVNGGLMAEYNPADAGPNYNATEGRFIPGSFGAGTRITNDIYWFDATSAYLGCNNTKMDSLCQISVTGYRWTTKAAPDGSVAGSEEILWHSQNFTIKPCVSPPCELTQFYFDLDHFKGLSTINIKAQSGDEEMGFFLDSFELTWSNDTCAAGLARQSTP